MAPSDIQKSDVLRAIAEYDRLGQRGFLQTYDFGPARKNRLVDHGKFYDSKAIAGVAHGFATGEFWTKKRPFGGDGPDGAVTILRNLGFLVDEGELSELTKLTVDRSHGKAAPYQYVVLLWAIAKARAGQPPFFPFQDVSAELAELLAPFAISKSAPNPAMPWLALRRCYWWHLFVPEDIEGLTESDVASGNIAAEYQSVTK